MPLPVLVASAVVQVEAHAGIASTAAEIRDAFYKRCEGLEKREVALKLASQGVQEESKAYYDVSTRKRTTKRVYTYVFPGGGANMVKK